MQPWHAACPSSVYQGLFADGDSNCRRAGASVGSIESRKQKNKTGSPDEQTFFNEADEYLAQILASQLKVVVEATQVAETLASLSWELHNSATERQFFERLLEKVSESLGCERSDYFAYDHTQGNLTWKAAYGPVSVTKLLPCPTPQDSVVASLIDSAENGVSVDDVTKESRYWAAWEKTRSQGAVLVRDHTRVIGVISAESEKLGWFDKHALERMKTISKVCAPLIHSHSIETAVGELYAGRPTRETLSQHLKSVADAVRRIVGFEGLAVVAIYDQGGNKSYTLLQAIVKNAFLPPRIIESAHFLDRFADKPAQQIATVQNFSEEEVRAMRLEGSVLVLPLDATYGKVGSGSSSGRNFKSTFALLCWPLPLQSLQNRSANPVQRIKPFAEVIAHHIDVAYESNAEAELHRRYHEALNMLPQRVFQKDEKGKFVAVNNSLAQALGVDSPESVEGKTDFDFFPKETAEKYRADDLRVMQSRATLSWYETFHPKKKKIGDEGKVILVIKSPILGPPNPYWPTEVTRRVIGVIGIFWDVSESVMFMKCADNGRLLWLNPLAEAVFGKAADATNLFDLLDAANAAKLRKIFESTPGISQIRSDRLISIALPKTVTINEGDSRIRILELTEVVAEPSEDSDTKGYRILALDVTVSEQRDERIKMRNWRAVLPGLLALGIAHGLRHLIGSVQIQERNLRKEIRTQDHLIPTPVVESIQRFMETFRRIKLPVDELMKLRETQDNLDQLRLLEKQPNKILNLFHRAQEAIHDGQLAIDYSGVHNFLTVNVHGTLLAEVFHNLLNNAIKHASSRKLVVTAELIKNQAHIKVRDFGGGIPEDILPNIFEPFFTTKPTDGGNGIGLAFARAVVEDVHHGRIFVANHPNGGAVFEIFLPEASIEQNKL